jgi:RNA polymerase sigma-70 factor, ECF subfamily
MPKLSDEDLMLATGRGDVDAFEQLVRRHQTFAWAVAYRYVGNREDAEDLTQDAFLRLLSAASRYRPTAAFRTYFSRILCRLCLDYIQKKRPHLSDDLPDCEDLTPRADTLLLQEEQAAGVRRALRLLPPNQRLAVILRYYEDYNYKDIATALEVTEKAAERLLARGRANLGNLLQDSS